MLEDDHGLNAQLNEKELIDAALDAQLDIFFVYDRSTGQAVRWNRAFKTITGYADEEIAAMCAPDSYFTPDDLKQVNAFIQRALHKDTGAIEVDLTCKDGRKAPFEFRVSGIKGKSGKPSHVIAIGRDVADRRRADQALKNSEAEYRTLFEAAGDGITLIKGSKFVTCNQSLLDLLGCSRDYVIDRSPWDISPPTQADGRNSKEKALEMIACVELGEKHSFEWTHLKCNGEHIEIEVTLRLIDSDGQPVILCHWRDITERKLAEDALRASKARLSSIVRAAPVGIATVRNHVFTSVSDRLCSFLGYTREELIGANTRILYRSDEDHRRVSNIMYPQLENGDVGLIEAQLVRRDGSLIDVVITGAWLDPTDKDGDVVFLQLDITELKRTQSALREREEMVRSIVETSQDWIWSVDANGVATYCNPAVEKILGYAPEELVGQRVLAFMHNDDGKLIEEKLPVWISEKSGWSNLRIRWRHKKGGYRLLESSGTPILESDGRVTGFRGVDRDITEREEAREALRTSEQRLHNAEKMASLGLLAGGVAHDFNNLLTVMLGNAEFVHNEIDAAGLSAESIEAIGAAGERAAQLTQRLLAFSRSQVVARRVVDLNQVMLGIDGMLRRVIGADIELVSIPDPQAGLTKVDVGQFEQVLINLAVNARDAMPSGGKLTLRTRNIELDSATVESYGELPSGRYIEISVSDTGIGIDADVVERIFEPLFTTKEVGKGTGLGLAICAGIVKESGGHIAAESERGVGTTIRIHLPIVEGECDESCEDVSPASEYAKGHETILLVDDEPDVRDLAVRALNANGYRVIEASNGNEALEIVRCGEEVDLLVTDIVMPQMSGGRLAELIAEQIPELKVLYVSGYTPDSEPRMAGLDPASTFLAKPFTPSSLAMRVRELLDS